MIPFPTICLYVTREFSYESNSHQLTRVCALTTKQRICATGTFNTITNGNNQGALFACEQRYLTRALIRLRNSARSQVTCKIPQKYQRLHKTTSESESEQSSCPNSSCNDWQLLVEIGTSSKPATCLQSSAALSPTAQLACRTRVHLPAKKPMTGRRSSFTNNWSMKERSPTSRRSRFCSSSARASLRAFSLTQNHTTKAF